MAITAPTISTPSQLRGTPELRDVPRGTIDVLLLAATALIVMVGIVSVYSGSAYRSTAMTGRSTYFLEQQVVGALIGLVVMAFAMRFDYRHYYRLIIPIFVGSFLLLVPTLIPGLGVEVNGARRWVGLGPVNIQPAEIVKVAVVMFMAFSVTKKKDRVQNSLEFFGHPLVLLPFIGILMLQPDFGTSLIISLMTGAMLFVAGARWMHIIFVIMSMGILGTAAVFTEGYRMQRILVWLDPWADQANSGYQLTQTWAALSRGGLDGVGFGNSVGPMGYVPELHTDFVAAVAGEQFGFIGFAALVVLFALLAWRGYRVAHRAVDRFGFYLAFGLTTLIVLQASINLAVVTGVFPTKGLTLPFISFGRSSMIVMFFVIGVLLNISQRNPDTWGALKRWKQEVGEHREREESLRGLAEKQRSHHDLSEARGTR